MKDSLNFNKSAVVELNDSQMRGTDSGITPTLGFVAIGFGLAYLWDQVDGDND